MKGSVVVVGSLNVDLVASVARQPTPGETISGTAFHRFIGGKGANQAVAAALGGAAVQIVGRHGTDGFEVEILDMLRGKGVDVAGVRPAEGASGVAMILVQADGQNSIVVVPGANGRLTGEDVRAERGRIGAAGLVLTQLETPMEALEATLEVAAQERVGVMLDPAPARRLAPDLLGQVTWLTPNETEAAMLLEVEVPGEDGVRGFAERLLGLGAKNVILKLGGRGAYLATGAGVREWVRAAPVEAVDTTAAGDALNGAFAAALVGGADAIEAVRFGVAAASLSVTRAGAIPSLATRAEIEAFRQRLG